MGQKVRTVEGFEDTVMPGYEGHIVAGELQPDGKIAVTIQVTRIPDGTETGFAVGPDQHIEMHTYAEKLEPID